MAAEITAARLRDIAGQNERSDRMDPAEGPVYDGTATEAGTIALTNGLFSLVTLGFYRFWGKTRLRRYLWSRVSWGGDRLEYTGRGIELFLGFLIAMAILVPLIVGFGIVQGFLVEGSAAAIFAELAFYALFYFLIQLAIFRARRYRLSRTQWRGIRAGQSGSSLRYGALAMGWGLVTLITVGLAYPLMRVRLQRYRSENTWIGDQSFEFAGRARELFGAWLIAILLMLPTLGISYTWYRVREFRYFAARTTFGSLSFESRMETASVVIITFFFYLVIYALFGMVAWVMFDALGSSLFMDPATLEQQLPQANFDPSALVPVVAVVVVAMVLAEVAKAVMLLHPLLRVACQTLTIRGLEDFDHLGQSQISTPGRGEGLADALDVGAF